MIVRMGLLTKRVDFTTESFRKYWLEVHGLICSEIPNLYRYHQNHIYDSSQLGVDYPRGPQVIDGISELWFDDLLSMNYGIAESSKMVAEDAALFIEKVQIIVAVQNVVVPIASDKPLIKRMSLLKRHPDVNAETFHREWLEVHAKFVQSIPGIEGYVQNLVINRSEKGKSVSYEDIPIDGIVELWFENTDTLKNAFSSPAGRDSVAHAKTFLGDVTPFLVEPCKIV